MLTISASGIGFGLHYLPLSKNGKQILLAITELLSGGLF